MTTTVTTVVTCDVCRKPIEGLYYHARLTSTVTSQAVLATARAARDRTTVDLHRSCMRRPARDR